MTEDSLLTRYAELHEAGGYREANAYLAAGYDLLHITDRTAAKMKPDGSKQIYVQRKPVFILGRTADVAHFEPEREAEAVPA